MTKSGLHFVEDEHESKLIRKISEALKIAGFWLDDTDILQNRFRNQCCYWVFLAYITDGLKVIEIDAMNQLLMVEWNSSADGNERIFTRRSSRAYFVQRCHQVA